MAQILQVEKYWENTLADYFFLQNFYILPDFVPVGRYCGLVRLLLELNYYLTKLSTEKSPGGNIPPGANPFYPFGFRLGRQDLSF